MAQIFFERTARVVRTASQSIRTADKCLLNGYPFENGYPLGTFLCERSHLDFPKRMSISLPVNNINIDYQKFKNFKLTTTTKSEKNDM